MKSEFFKKTGKFAKKNVVMLIALLLAIVTCFFIPPDAEYLNYFDFNTLSCLLAVLAIVCALKNVNFFYFLADRTVKLFKSARSSVLALVYITFIGSMLPRSYKHQKRKIYDFYFCYAERGGEPWRNADAFRQSAESVSLFQIFHSHARIYGNYGYSLRHFGFADYRVLSYFR